MAQEILAGGDDFLYKAVSEVVLLAKVRAMLRIVAMQEELHDAHRKLRKTSVLDSLPPPIAATSTKRRAPNGSVAPGWKASQESPSATWIFSSNSTISMATRPATRVLEPSPAH
ncbi:hypothetical protein [Quatrionicoccus australiensis]|uniref:hypothetical protein n=1 Tax=Quatrionicoccus australiensis TaxID=138118 RepID=UPI001CFA5094|nr:hypothetical protein [Quatrionicoccus australiensis]